MADQTLLNRQKFKSIEKMLYGDHALVHIIPTKEGVILPDHLLKDPTVTLKISKLFNGYLRLEKEAIETELRFSGEYFECIIPYAAIWGATDENGQSSVWPESAPNEVLTELLEKSTSAGSKPSSKPALESVPQEKSVKDDGAQESSAKSDSRKRPQLKLVKS